jgi:hypothetical protein
MICALSSEQYLDFLKTIGAFMWEQTRNDKPFDAKSFTKMIYDELNDNPEDDSLALTYAQLIPSFIIKAAAFDKEIRNALRAKKVSLDELSDLSQTFEDPNTGLDAVKNYVTPAIKKAATKDLAEAQKKKDSAKPTKVEKPEDIVPATVEVAKAKAVDKTLKTKAFIDQDVFSAVKPSLLTTQDNEAISSDKSNENYNKPKPELIPYFHALRTVIQKILSNNDDASKVNLGDAKGLYLTVVKASDIKKKNPEYLRQDMNEGDTVIMLTDKTGTPVLFEMNPESDSYGKVTPEGKPYMSYFPSAKNLTEKDFYKASMFNMINSMVRSRGLGGTDARKKAVAILSEQQALINDVHSFLEKNPGEQVVLDILSANTGYIERDRNLMTPMAQIQPGEVNSFTVHAIANPTENLHAGDLSFTTKSTGKKELLANRPLLKDSPEYLDDIITFLFDTIFNTDGTVLSLEERKQLILPYIKLGENVGSVNVDIEFDEEDGEYRVKLNDQTIYSSLDDTDDAMGKGKDLVKAAFEGLVRGSDISLQVKAKRDILNDKEASETEVEKAKSYLDLILPEGSAPEEGKISIEDGKYYFYGYPRLNANAAFINNPYNKATIGLDKKGQVTVDIVSKDYNNDYLLATSNIPYQLSGDNKIRTMNPYLIFDSSEDTKKQLDPKAAEEKKVVPVKEALKEVAGDRRNTLNDLLAFDKRKAQKSGNKKMTPEEISAREAEIKKWWANSDLSKIPGFTLQEAFDIANSEDPNSIARFTLSGVTLYKGSDYTDLYHEAWHTFTQIFMNQSQRDAMYNEARNRDGFFTDYKNHRVAFGRATDKQLEEHLAEEFREFMLAEGKNLADATPVKKKWFQKIWDFLKNIFSKIGTKDMIANDTANRTIYDLFKNLAMNNMTGYSFSKKNAQFGHGLNQTLEAFTDEAALQNLSLEDSRELVMTLDSLMSENIDIIVKAQQLKQNKLGSTKWATSMLKDPVKIKLLYKAVKQHLNEIITGLNNKYESLEPEIAAERFQKEVKINPKITLQDVMSIVEKEYKDKKALIERKLNLYDWATNNFGNLDNIMLNRPADGGNVKGLIGYHMLKSKIIDEDFKETFFDEDIESEDDLLKKGRTGYERGGNETSLKDQASKEIIFLLSGLHKVKDGKTVFVPGTEYEAVIDGVVTKTGVPELEDFDVVWNTLVKGLTNILDREVMYEKLKMMAENKDLPFKQLLDFKIGSVYNQTSNEEFAIWNNFFQTFNKAYIPLLQTTLEVTNTEGVNGIETRSFVVKPGRATSNVKQVERAWRESFATKDTRFIKPDKGGIRQLDLTAVRQAYPTMARVNADKIGFLKAVGFDLEDNEEIRKELEDGVVNLLEVHDYIVENASWRLDENGNSKIIIRDITDYKKALPEDRDYYQYSVGKQGLQKTTAFKQYKFFPTAVYTSILELQARHSAKFANFMVSNAKGDTQFEHSLNNSMSVMVNAVNSSATYEDLISLPWMQHLDYRRNPRAENSAWLKALYPGFGEKRKINGAPVKLTLENLSGIAVSVDGVFDNNASTSSAGADKNSKVLMDLHNTLIKGVPELMRHSDKSTSFTMFVNKMNNTYSRGTSLYAVPGAFYTKENRSVAESDLVKNMFLPNLFAEFESVQISRTTKKEIEKIAAENKIAKEKGQPLKPYPVLDYKYLDKAQEFVSFKGVLSEETQKKLYALMDRGVSDLSSVLELTPEAELAKMKPDERKATEENNKKRNDLKGLIISDVYNYMDGQVANYKKTIKGVSSGKGITSVISENMQAELTKQISQVKNIKQKITLTDAELEDTLAKAFVWNSWLHNIESTNFLYGDPAQYNMVKEEFHKRNAAFSSTGTVYAVDKSAQEFINRVVGRGLASKLSEQDPSFLEGARRPFDGTFNTAVIKDQSIRSIYIEDYAAKLRESEKKKNPKITEDELNKKLFGEDKKTGKIGGLNEGQEIYKGGLLHAYSDMTEGDGQGWISFDSYRILLKLEGIWSDKQEYLYNKIVKGEKVDAKDVLETFPVQKLQYAGPLKSKGLPVNAFHKFSLVPLIPTVIQNTKLKEFHEKMMREGIDYATFLSGSKVGTLTQYEGVDEIYTADRKISNAPFTKNTIFLNFLKNQLAIAPKFKEKVVFSTQLRKLIEDGLVENGIPVDFMQGKPLTERRNAWKKALAEGKGETPKYKLYKMYEALVDKESRVKKRELIDEIGWSLDPATGEPMGDPQNIVDFIHREFSNKDLAEHELAFIKTDGQGNLDTDLSLSLSATKIEKMLNAIVSKRLITQKVTGEGLIQVSGSMFENADILEGATNATKEDLKKWGGTNGLRTYNSEDLDFTQIYKGLSKEKLKEKLKEKEDIQTEHAKYWADSYRNAGLAEIQYLKDVIAGKKPTLTKITKPTSAMKIKIALQGGFKHLLNLEDVKTKATEEGITRIQALNKLIQDEVWLSQKDNRKLVTLTGVRIPVQGLNSMEFMEVYEFLPEEAGNIVIVPSEIVAKSGSDFDVDKLTVMMPAIGNRGGKVGLVKYDSSIKQSKAELKNELADLQSKKAEAEDVFERLFAEAKDAKVFKTLTEDEKEVLAQIKAQYGDRDAQLQSEIKDLRKEWIKINRKKKLTSGERYQLSAIQGNIEALSKEKDGLYEKFQENKDSYKSELFKGKLKTFSQEQRKDVKELEEKINDINQKIDSVSTKGIENDLISAIAEILSQPDIFADFITPNSTDATQPLANDLEKEVSEYSFKKPGAKSIEGTRIFEYEYNLYKHQVNKVGKEVLGIGAVDNTFNIIFNRVGAYLRSKVGIVNDKGVVSGYYKQKLHMKHNTLMDEEYNEEAISLSDIMDADNNYKISDIISQLMNGWVDVAKDAWIFNIQGNKEVGPVLLFLVQAGVPIKTAAYFLSQPIIREYADRLRKSEGAFAVALGDSIIGNKEKVILGDLMSKFGDVERNVLKQHNDKNPDKEPASKLSTEMVLSTVFGTTMLDADRLEKSLKNNSDTKDAEQYAILRHFKEVLDMSNSVKNVKVNLNPDTKRSTTIYEAISKKQAIEDVDKNRLSPNLVSDIMNDTVIKSFNIQKFQIGLFKDLFKLTLKPELLSSLGNLSKDQKKNVGMSSKGDAPDLGNLYRNDFASFLFQNKLKYFDPRNINYYKKYDIVKEEDKQAKRFTRGASFKDGKLYLDINRIEQDFKSEVYTGKPSFKDKSNTYRKLGIATVPLGTFEHVNEYSHFVIEREYLRTFYKSPAVLAGDLDYASYVQSTKKDSPIQEDETAADFEERISNVAFEVYLRNKALENIWNTASLFKGEHPFSDRLMRIQDKFKDHPTLLRDYPVIKDLKINSISKKVSGTKVTTTYSNIVAINKLDDVELLEDYHSAIVKLADPNVRKVEDDAENAYISDFFRKLSIVAYLQSGQNTKSSFSITRMVSDQEYITLMKDNSVNVENSYLPQNMQTYQNKFVEANAVAKGSLRNRFKNYTSWDKNVFSGVNKVMVKADNVTKVKEVPYTEVANSMLYKTVNDRKIPLLSASRFDILNNRKQVVVAQTISAVDFSKFLLGSAEADSEKTKKSLAKFAELGYPKEMLLNLLSKESRFKTFLVHYEKQLDANQVRATNLFQADPEIAVKAIEDLKESLQIEAEGMFMTLSPEGVTQLAAETISDNYLEGTVTSNPDKLFLFDDLTNPDAKATKKELRGNRRLRALKDQGNTLGLPVIGKYNKATTADMVMDSKVSPVMPAASTVRQVYQGYNTLEDREFNYFTADAKEAADYGKNVRNLSLDTADFLKASDPKYRTLVTEFNKTGKTFDILNNTKEGLAIQADFFRFLKNKGYKGLDMLDGVDSKYAISFSKPESNTKTAREIYDALGNITQSENVILPNDLEENTTYTGKNFWSEIVPEAKDMFDNKTDRKTGEKKPLLIAYRGNSKKTFLANYKDGFTAGNPFDWQNETGTREEQGVKSTKRFIHWMITGDNMGNDKAAPEYRQAIINDIQSGRITNSPILYYQEKGFATHATALDYLINKYEWGKPAAKAVTNSNVEQVQFNGVDPGVKAAIDGFIKNILASGKTPVFPKEGLAQEWIGNYNIKDEITAPTKALAPQSFIYLSRELYKHFGWVNNNWLEGYSNLYDPNTQEMEFVQAEQDFTDKELEEFIKDCKTHGH